MTQNTFCEHIVKQKRQGKLLVIKILIIALYIALEIIPTVALIALAPSFLLVPFILIVTTVVVIIYKITWKYTCIEFEYQIIDDTIIFTKIYGKTKRKNILEMPIRAFSVLGAHTAEAEKYLSELLVDKSFLFISSFDAENIYFGEFEAEGEKCIIFFEVNEATSLRLKRHAPLAIRAYERKIK